VNIQSSAYPVLWEFGPYDKSAKLCESPFPTEVDSHENSWLLKMIRAYFDKVKPTMIRQVFGVKCNKNGSVTR
jgi:hypothetical protein